MSRPLEPSLQTVCMTKYDASKKHVCSIYHRSIFPCNTIVAQKGQPYSARKTVTTQTDCNTISTFSTPICTDDNVKCLRYITHDNLPFTVVRQFPSLHTAPLIKPFSLRLIYFVPVHILFDIKPISTSSKCCCSTHDTVFSSWESTLLL
jgi:hypothetical protein